MVNVGDYGNNALDLVSTGIGAAVGVAVLLVMRRPNPDSALSLA
jgi:hypothetical protein